MRALRRRVQKTCPEVYKVSITGGEMKIVYYGYITGDTIHKATVAYTQLTRKQRRASYAYIAYNEQDAVTMQSLFNGACHIQQRPEKRLVGLPGTASARHGGD